MRDFFDAKEREAMERIDEKLSTPAQLQISEAVKALPEETLSLAWRSELNGRLRETLVKRQKVRLMAWIWKPALGAAMAGALAIAFVARTPVANAPVAPQMRAANVEASLVNEHIASAASWDVAGVGVTEKESQDVTTTPSGDEWDQEDVGATL